MGYAIDQIEQGLTGFNSNESDNPGRLNSFKLKNGARVIIDFAHNAHSVAAVVDTVGAHACKAKMDVVWLCLAIVPMKRSLQLRRVFAR